MSKTLAEQFPNPKHYTVGHLRNRSDLPNDGYVKIYSWAESLRKFLIIHADGTSELIHFDQFDGFTI